MPVTSPAPAIPQIRIYPMIFQRQNSFFILPEDLIKVIQYKIDNAVDQSKRTAALRILVNFQRSCRERNVHTIPFQEANEILVQLQYLSAPSSDTEQLIKEDADYKKAMEMFETKKESSPIKILCSRIRAVMFSSQVLFHLFRTFVCGINWKSNCCSEHTNCLQDYKQAVLTCMKKYHNLDGKLYSQLHVQNEMTKLKALCYYKNRQVYTQLWVGKNYPSLLDIMYQRLKTRFELPEFSFDLSTVEICADHRFHLMKMWLYEGWMFNFVGCEHADLWASICDAIGLTLPKPIFRIAIVDLDATLRRLKEAQNASSTIEHEVSTPIEDIPSTVDNPPSSVSDEEQELNTESETDSSSTTASEPITDFSQLSGADSPRPELDESEEDQEAVEESENDPSERNLENLREEMNTLRITEVQSDEVLPAVDEPMEHNAHSERIELLVSQYMQQLAERLTNFGSTAAQQEMMGQLAHLIRVFLLHEDRSNREEEQTDENQRISEILRSRDSLRPAGDVYVGPSAFHVVRNNPEGLEETCSQCTMKIKPDDKDLTLDCKECSSAFHAACQWDVFNDATLICPTCGRKSLDIRPTKAALPYLSDTF